MLADSVCHIADSGGNLNEYSFEEVWLFNDKTADLPHPLRDVYAAPCSWLLQSFCVYQFVYERGMMTVAFSTVVNVDEGMLSKAFENSAGRQVFKQDFYMVFVDGRHCCQDVLTLQNDGPLWNPESICVWGQVPL